MAQIENYEFRRNAKCFGRQKNQVIRIDMTPMVDLGFLLITFFIFTTTMSRPAAIDFFMPEDDVENMMPLPESLALTLLLDDHNKVYFYYGGFNNALKANEIFESDYSIYAGIGKAIRQKQRELDKWGKFKDGKRGLMLLIKPTSKSNYKNIIDVLDEAMINDVRKYAIIEPKIEEIDYIRSKVN